MYKVVPGVEIWSAVEQKVLIILEGWVSCPLHSTKDDIYYKVSCPIGYIKDDIYNILSCPFSYTEDDIYNNNFL